MGHPDLAGKYVMSLLPVRQPRHVEQLAVGLRETRNQNAMMSNRSTKEGMYNTWYEGRVVR